MGLEILLPLLLPIITPVLTELVKKLAGFIVNDVPANVVRSVAVVSAAAATEGFRAAGIDLFPGVDSRAAEDALGAAIGGGGGVGLHMGLRAFGITDKQELATKTKKAIALLLLAPALLVGLSACAFVQDVADKADDIVAHFCVALPVIESAMDTAALAASAKGDGALAGQIVDARGYVVKYGSLVCPKPSS